MIDESSSDDKSIELVNVIHNKNNITNVSLKDDAIYATPTKNKSGNPKDIVTDPILKVEH